MCCFRVLKSFLLVLSPKVVGLKLLVSGSCGIFVVVVVFSVCGTED